MHASLMLFFIWLAVGGLAFIAGALALASTRRRLEGETSRDAAPSAEKRRVLVS